jgi:hypothetical protein
MMSALSSSVGSKKFIGNILMEQARDSLRALQSLHSQLGAAHSKKSLKVVSAKAFAPAKLRASSVTD